MPEENAFPEDGDHYEDEGMAFQSTPDRTEKEIAASNLQLGKQHSKSIYVRKKKH